MQKRNHIIFYLLFIFMLLPAWIAAQNIYETSLKFVIPDYSLSSKSAGETFISAKAFIVLNENGNGFMRLTWKDKMKQVVLVDMEISEKSMTVFDADSIHPEIIYCAAEKVKCRKGKLSPGFEMVGLWMLRDRQSNQLIPFPGPVPSSFFNGLCHFVLGEKNDQEKFAPGSYYEQYIPASWKKRNKEGINYLESNDYCSTVMTLSNKSLTRTLLQPYFEDFELPFHGTITVKSLSAARLRNLPTIYCITLASTRDSLIGSSCEGDANKMEGLFESIADYLHFRYRKINISGNQFNISVLKATLTRLKPMPNDVIVFTYSGHGFSYDNDAKNIFPNLLLWSNNHPKKTQIRSNSINLEQVFNIIKSKNARLNFVFGDCCNSYIGMDRYIDQEERLRMNMFNWKKSTVMKLFAEAKGSFISAAAKKGQMACSNVSLGGFFTDAINTILQRSLELVFITSPEEKWKQMITEIGEESFRLSTQFGCHEEMIYRYVK